MHFCFVFVFKGSSQRERSKLRDEPCLHSLEDQIRGGNCKSGGASAEVLNSGLGAVRGIGDGSQL